MRFIVILLMMSWITSSIMAQDIPITAENASKLEQLYTIPTLPRASSNRYSHVVWSETNSRLLLHENGRVEVYDLTTGDTLWSYEIDEKLHDVEADEELHYVFIRTSPRGPQTVHIEIWDIDTNTLQGTIDDDPDEQRGMGIFIKHMPEVNRLYTWDFTPPLPVGIMQPDLGRIKVWDFDGTLINEVELPTAPEKFSLSPDHTRILVRRLVHAMVEPSILTVDGELIATLSHEKMGEYWGINAVWSADGSRIFSYVGDQWNGLVTNVREAHIWTADGEHLLDLTPYDDWRGIVIYNDDFTRFLLIDERGAFVPQLIDENGETITEFTEMIRNDAPVRSYVSPDGQHIFFTNIQDEDDTLPLLVMYNDAGEILDVSMSPDAIPISSIRGSMLADDGYHYLTIYQSCIDESNQSMALWNPTISLEEPEFSVRYSGWMRRVFFLPERQLIIGEIGPNRDYECLVEADTHKFIVWDMNGTELFSTELDIERMYINQVRTQILIGTPDEIMVWGIPSD